MGHKLINLTGQTSIGELPALLSACDLFVGNDCGAMHVAGAVGLPTVGRAYYSLACLGGCPPKLCGGS